MPPIELNKRRIFLLAAAVFVLVIFWTGVPSSERVRDGITNIPIPGLPQGPERPYGKDPDEAWDYPDPEPVQEKKPEYHAAPPVASTSTSKGPIPAAPTAIDQHPITLLMEKADLEWRAYEGGASQTFRQTVEKYRSKYGRHPPPGFKEWYKFARERHVVNIDDFEHIMDDLRPFWTMKPADIRSHAAHMWEDEGHGAAGIHIRDHKFTETNFPSWRSETFEEMVKPFIKHLPDIDIAMNRLDQPRVIVPYEDLQKMLKEEEASRVMPPEAVDSFTTKQSHLLDTNLKDPKLDNSTRLDGGWFGHAGKQYMEVAAKACPPESPARRNHTEEETDALYKEPSAGIVTNFNLSSDLCTVGPTIKDLHGMLYSASSMTPTHKLVPIFGECKVNVNNDILFPANMYYLHDLRYDYDPSGDLDWRDKSDTMIWRGVTSGGVQIPDNWERMHRQRLVQMSNGTWTKINHKTYAALSASPQTPDENARQHYSPVPNFKPSSFATQHTDVGFVQAWGCIPGDCSFYNNVFSMKNQTTLTSQFESRYLIDVDGHSFSGRWHAFLQSKSLGLKATIFREWHDSRLFQWRHFVPLDNRYEELYAILTYFIGYDGTKAPKTSENFASGLPGMAVDDEGLPLPVEENPKLRIPAHDKEAQKIARQSREWANKVLRREDIEVYMFRLLLEYARICDDNRERIGYSGDGSELEGFDNGEVAGGLLGVVKGKWPWGGKSEDGRGGEGGVGPGD